MTAAQKFLAKNLTTGATERITPALVGGAGVLGQIPALGELTGLLDLSMMPSGIGPDVVVLATGENVVAGQFVTIKDNAGTPTVYKASATDLTKPAMGFVLVGETAPAPATVYLEGYNNLIPVAGFTAADAGKRVFLNTTGGGATLTPPVAAGNYQQVLGRLIQVDATYAYVNFVAAEGVTM